MGGPELRHRVIAIFRKDPLVELLGPLDAHVRIVIGDCLDSQIGFVNELIEKEPAH